MDKQTDGIVTRKSLVDMKISKETELDLIRRAQNGEPSAARMLVDAHKERLFAFIWRIARNPDLTEDICQETFLRAFTALSSFNEEYRFSTWLFTIGYRIALNQIRAHRNVEGGHYDMANVPARGEHPQLDNLLQSESATRVRQLIWEEVDRLSSVQRATLHMFYREGASCQEIAESLAIPVATVKSHMHRARKRLRVRLQQRGIDSQDLVHFGA